MGPRGPFDRGVQEDRLGAWRRCRVPSSIVLMDHRCDRREGLWNAHPRRGGIPSRGASRNRARPLPGLRPASPGSANRETRASSALLPLRLGILHPQRSDAGPGVSGGGNGAEAHDLYWKCPLLACHLPAEQQRSVHRGCPRPHLRFSQQRRGARGRAAACVGRDRPTRGAYRGRPFAACSVHASRQAGGGRDGRHGPGICVLAQREHPRQRMGNAEPRGDGGLHRVRAARKRPRHRGPQERIRASDAGWRLCFSRLRRHR
mmetsp:Transcript_20428/g.48517  ORF Transcript_20428/g.48517 Transcript_20428/m.48517 type:complete len:261 (+) Transcript_20428:1177-1959(+)